MAGQIKIAIQSVANKFGFQIRRLDRNVNLIDPYLEQQRILGGNAKTIFEVGACDGRDSVRYTRLFADARVYAFEPVPESFEKLRLNAEANPRIAPVNEAISDQAGIATFHISNWIQASSLLVPKKTGSAFDAYQASASAIEVAVNTLDGFCNLSGIEHINLLKMDTQGAELKVLKGGDAMLRSGVDLIYTEAQFLESYEGSARFDQLMSFLYERDFRLHNLYDMMHNQTGRLAWCDAIFVHSRIKY